MHNREVPSEAHLDAPRDLVRMAHRHNFNGNLGGLRGAEFVGGVAQNGVSRHVAERLIGIMGHDLTIVGPWEEPTPPAAVEPDEPAPPTAPTPPPPAPPSRKR